MKVATRETRRAQLETVRAYLRDYPASVAAVSYAGDAPPLVPLGSLLTLAELSEESVDNPVLLRFAQRLKKARPDLTLEELLLLPAPASSGDQEVYTARLGKWMFEKRMLETDVQTPSKRR